jgi:uncharacterized protein YoxC
MPSTETILTILVTVIAAAGLIQLFVFVAMFVAIKKGMKLAGEYATELRTDITPVLEHSKKLLYSTKELMVRLEPKLEAAATDVADLAHIASTEARKMQESADEVAERVRRQAARVDEMATDALNTVDRVGNFVSQAVTVPLRQVSGVVAAGKAIFETLRSPAPRGRSRG